jgi:tetratricopeptide (TPR) repeat protein
MCRLDCCVLLILLLSAGLCAQNDSRFCEEPADLRAAMMELPPVPPGPARQASVKPLVAKYPGDFWVQRIYIDAMREPGSAAGEGVVAQFKKRFDAMPGDPEAAYLYAYTLLDKEILKAVEIFTAVARQTPGLPAAWLTLATLYNSPGSFDLERVRFYWEGYVDRCPHSADTGAVLIALQLDKSDRLLTYAANLREQIAGRADRRIVGLFTLLWSLEAKITLPSELPQFRKRVEEDVRLLEGLNGLSSLRLDSTLIDGYRITGNRQALERVSTQAAPAAPDSSKAFSQAYLAWIGANGTLRPGLKLGSRKAYYLKQLQFLDAWMPVVPDNWLFSSLRFTALAETAERGSVLLILEGDRLLDLTRTLRIPTINPPAAYMAVARAWAYHGLELARIPSLAKETMDATEKTGAPPPSDLYPESFHTLRREVQGWGFREGTWGILVTAYSKTGNFGEARRVLTEWEAALQRRRDHAERIRARRPVGRSVPAPRATAGRAPLTESTLEDSLVSGLPAAEARYDEALAELALAEGRKSDALKLYQAALRVERGGRWSYAGLIQLETVEKAQRLWTDLGGTPAAWRAWLESISMPPPLSGRAVPQ